MSTFQGGWMSAKCWSQYKSAWEEKHGYWVFSFQFSSSSTNISYPYKISPRYPVDIFDAMDILRSATRAVSIIVTSKSPCGGNGGRQDMVKDGKILPSGQKCTNVERTIIPKRGGTALLLHPGNLQDLFRYKLFWINRLGKRCFYEQPIEVTVLEFGFICAQNFQFWKDFWPGFQMEITFSHS